GRNARFEQSIAVQQQNAATNAGRLTEQQRHNVQSEQQAATNETGRTARAQNKGKAGGLMDAVRARMGGQVPATAPQGQTAAPAAPSQPPVRGTMTRAKYSELVRKYGQARVDQENRNRGIIVQ